LSFAYELSIMHLNGSLFTPWMVSCVDKYFCAHNLHTSQKAGRFD
jgi:hypothetical protein